VTQTRVLVILPKTDAVLLVRERQAAADVEAALLRLDTRSVNSLDERVAAARERSNLAQRRHGLAVHPAPGMEPVFVHWMELSNDFANDAILGLKKLNTPASRAALATLARAPSKPNTSTQDGATAALATLGDRQYYPLMVDLLASADERVRSEAADGVANLGGEDGVAKLLAELRAGRNVPRAVFALGNTASRAAVKGLIDLMATDQGHTTVNARWPLYTLTHHQLPDVSVPRTAEQTYREWLQWWETVGKDGPVYSKFECARM
jgi:hypothetical protein